MDFHIKGRIEKICQPGQGSGVDIIPKRSPRFGEKEWVIVLPKETNRLIYKKGILTIYTNSSSLKQELFNSREKVKEVVNQYLEEDLIQQVIIR